MYDIYIHCNLYLSNKCMKCINLGVCVALLAIHFKHDNVIKWNIFPRYWPFVRGIHQSPVNSPHKGQWRGALMFYLICAVNKRLSKQSRGWWFETPSRSLWHHCNSKPSISHYLTQWGLITHVRVSSSPMAHVMIWSIFGNKSLPGLMLANGRYP